MTDNALTETEHEFLNSVFDLARDNKPVALKSLFDQGVPVDLTNAKGDTLLILAAYHQHTDLVQILINEGADLDRLNDRGQTALVCAVFRNNLPIARMLLDAGADETLGTQTPAQVAQFFELDDMQKLFS
ncbi:ankyrin repeat domain-containing protein [Rothia endophytica]|uniref:ankyrin repeat domain-containing protein n=1 Tax=Rothia endophytica TaxID=1324766 RepID=UPI001F1C2B84|nr:ankyrin repeat domain-containing protein [Rothia endophytica]